MTETSPADAWDDAVLAAALFAIDPAGLGGVAVRSGAGPVRDRWTAAACGWLAANAPVRRIPLRVEDDRLLGGLDLALSLAAGRPVAQQGLLAESSGGVAILAMAERIEAGTTARITAAMDQGEVAMEREGLALRIPTRFGVIAFDEGLTPEERVSDALLQRLAFHLDLTALARVAPIHDALAGAVTVARARLPGVEPPGSAIVEALCAAAQTLGISSVRAPLLALRAARAHAALLGRSVILAQDAAVASRLVLAPRAQGAPPQPQSGPPEPDAGPQPDSPPDGPSDQAQADQPDPTPDSGDSSAETEMVLAAIQAALPDDLLAQISLDAPGRTATARARGSGASAKSALRGRPMGSRPGPLRSGVRLNLVETLRAAAPWQKVRSQDATSAGIQVRQSDFRIRRYVQRLESTTIFVVDASGSTAFQRLAEAKGAVELLLAKAYVSRAQVALIAFRGAEAEVLLPPTRSLTRAKSRLADLPGGGGTPLAAGVEAALTLALAEKAKTRTPLLVFLTDGRANIARDGAPGRGVAEADALYVSQQVREAGVAAVYLDTSPRTQPGGDRFAVAMGAVYAPLPYVDANAMVGLVDQFQPPRR